MLTFDNGKLTELKTDFLKLTNSLTNVLNSSEFLYQLKSFCSLFAYQAECLYNFTKVY